MEAIRIGRVGIGPFSRPYFEIGEELGELVCYGARGAIVVGDLRKVEVRFDDALHVRLRALDVSLSSRSLDSILELVAVA